jgi:ribosomal protein S18 acetylase RimI-like enzyme
MTKIVYSVGVEVADPQLNHLFGAAWPDHQPTAFAPVLDRSLTWVTAWQGDSLVGYVNIATDGGSHAFVLDTTVHPDLRRRGIGQELVRVALEEARAAGMAWMHVDHEPHLEGFYRGCGFVPTTAGLVDLRAS